MTKNRFKLNDKIFISLREMLAEYTAMGNGIMKLVDEWGETITQIDPDKHLEGSDLRGVDLSELDLSNANLSYANLSEARICYTNLSYANLSYARICYTNLRKANLWNAELSKADLRNAELSNANLSEARICNADLSKANLSEARICNTNLSYANLWNTNLCNADLRNAELSNANLSEARICYANLYGSRLHGAMLGTTPSVLKIPRGKLIGFKKIIGQDGVPFIAKLLIKGGTPRSKATTNKMRAKSVVVLGFYEVSGEKSKRTVGYSYYDTQFVYQLGKISCNNWDRDRWTECTGGIHFFLAWRDAVEYNV